MTSGAPSVLDRSITAKAPRRRRTYSSQVLDRAVSLLAALGDGRAERRLGEFSHLGLNKSTVYRLLESLRGHGMVELDPGTGRYRLGLRLFELGMQAVGRMELTRCAQAPLETLVQQTGETAHLGVLDKGEVVYLARAESPHALRMPSAVGRRSPAYCTGIGKALLAELPEPEVREYLAGTPLKALTRRTLSDPGDLLRELKAVRARGYSVDDEEIYPGVRCVAAPVRDHSGTVVAGVSVAGPATRMRRDQIAGVAERVMAAAADISGRLGCATDRQWGEPAQARRPRPRLAGSDTSSPRK